MYNEDTIVVDVKDKKHLRLLKNFYDEVYSKYTEKKLCKSYSSIVETLKNNNPEFKFYVVLYTYNGAVSGMMFYYDVESRSVIIESLISNPKCNIDTKFRILNWVGAFIRTDLRQCVEYYFQPFHKDSLSDCPLQSSMNFRMVDVIYKQPPMNKNEDGLDRMVLLCYPVYVGVRTIETRKFLDLLANYWKCNFGVEHPDRNSKFNYIALQIYSAEFVELKKIFSTIL